VDFAQFVQSITLFFLLPFAFGEQSFPKWVSQWHGPRRPRAALRYSQPTKIMQRCRSVDCIKYLWQENGLLRRLPIMCRLETTHSLSLVSVFRSLPCSEFRPSVVNDYDRPHLFFLSLNAYDSNCVDEIRSTLTCQKFSVRSWNNEHSACSFCVGYFCCFAAFVSAKNAYMCSCYPVLFLFRPNLFFTS